MQTKDAAVPQTPDFRERPSGLVRGEEGQVTVIFALMAISLVFFWMSVYQSGEVVCEKMKVQDVADACAYSGAVWGARMINLIAYTNRAIVANMVRMTELIIGRSNAKFWMDVAIIIGFICGLLDWIPYIGPVLNALASGLLILMYAYETVTYYLCKFAFREPSKDDAPWFILLHSLCALENTAHMILAPGPVDGFYLDTGLIGNGLNVAIVPMAIEGTRKAIDQGWMSGSGQMNIQVNPGFSSGAPFQVMAVSALFRQWTYESFGNLIQWPGMKHGVDVGNKRGDTNLTDGRQWDTNSAWNKTLNQKYILKWLITMTGKNKLTHGLWTWGRGNDAGGWLSDLTSISIVGIDFDSSTDVDLYYDGLIEELNLDGGSIFVRLGGPNQLQNDHEIEATDYLRVWYRKFWDLFDFPKETLFEVGDYEHLSEDADPGLWPLLYAEPLISVAEELAQNYENRQSSDNDRKTDYKGLPHQDNANHDLDLENPMDYFPLCYGELCRSNDKWLPTGIHELDNHKYQQKRQGDRAILNKDYGDDGYNAWSWFASHVPSYCYVLDAKKVARGGGGGGGGDDDNNNGDDDQSGGGGNHGFTLPKDDPSADPKQYGKRVGTVMTVAFKDAAKLPILDIMKDGFSNYSENAPDDATQQMAQTIGNGSGNYQQVQVDLKMLKSGKFNGFFMGGVMGWSAAEVFYENPNNPTEPPNTISPFWRARLTPFDKAYVRMEGDSNVGWLLKGVTDISLRYISTIQRILGRSDDVVDETVLSAH